MGMPPRVESSREVLSQAFGPLEVQVLEAVWRESRSVTVRDLQGSFPRCAYTTLMTTLDRLHKKGVLERTKIGRAFSYVHRFDRAEIERRLAARSIETVFMLTGGGAMHLALIAEMPLNKRFSVGLQADHVEIRTTGSHSRC